MSEVPPGYRPLTTTQELRAIAHPLRQRLAAALALQADSATGLATELGEPVARVHHHLQVLLRAGLIERAGDVRHGRARERLYRAPADAWWVPHSTFSGDSPQATAAWTQLEARVAAAATGFQEALVRSRAAGADAAETWQEADLRIPAHLAPHLPALLAGFMRTLEGLGAAGGEDYHVVLALHRKLPPAPPGGAR